MGIYLDGSGSSVQFGNIYNPTGFNSWSGIATKGQVLTVHVYGGIQECATGTDVFTVGQGTIGFDLGFTSQSIWLNTGQEGTEFQFWGTHSLNCDIHMHTWNYAGVVWDGSMEQTDPWKYNVPLMQPGLIGVLLDGDSLSGLSAKNRIDGFFNGFGILTNTGTGGCNATLTGHHATGCGAVVNDFSNENVIMARYGVNNGTNYNPFANGASNIVLDALSTSQFPLGLSAATYATATNCSSAASPAVCGSSAAGSVRIAASASTVQVNTTAVTANSQIQVIFDESLGSKLGVTCNTSTASEAAAYFISGRSAGASFTIKTNTAPTTNPACLSYTIEN
ncbi:MAG TPA: hypothetical protein VGW33_04980 [Terriglobia bacterium]|nr:hypothetical protein [Terriglobia bacterium]